MNVEDVTSEPPFLHCFKISKSFIGDQDQDNRLSIDSGIASLSHLENAETDDDITEKTKNTIEHSLSNDNCTKHSNTPTHKAPPILTASPQSVGKEICNKDHRSINAKDGQLIDNSPCLSRTKQDSMKSLSGYHFYNLEKLRHQVSMKGSYPKEEGVSSVCSDNAIDWIFTSTPFARIAEGIPVGLNADSSLSSKSEAPFENCSKELGEECVENGNANVKTVSSVYKSSTLSRIQNLRQHLRDLRRENSINELYDHCKSIQDALYKGKLNQRIFDAVQRSVEEISNVYLKIELISEENLKLARKTDEIREQFLNSESKVNDIFSTCKERKQHAVT